MQFASLIIQLQLPKNCQRLTTSHGISAHGWLMNLITQIDKNFGNKVHTREHENALHVSSN